MGRTSPACRLSAPSTGCLLFDGLGGWEGPWLHRETALRTPVLCESAVCTPYCDVGLRFAPKGPYEIVAPSTLLSFCLRTSKAARVWGTVLYLTYTGKFKYPFWAARRKSLPSNARHLNVRPPRRRPGKARHHLAAPAPRYVLGASHLSHRAHVHCTAQGARVYQM